MHIDLEQLHEVKDILGDKVKPLIEQYLEDTQILLSEIDVARSSGNDVDIINAVHSMKSSSFQVGANNIMEQAALVESFLRECEDEIAALHNQTRLDNMIATLRKYYAAYQSEIYNHL